MWWQDFLCSAAWTSPVLHPGTFNALVGRSVVYFRKLQGQCSVTSRPKCPWASSGAESKDKATLSSFWREHPPSHVPMRPNPGLNQNPPSLYWIWTLFIPLSYSRSQTSPLHKQSNAGSTSILQATELGVKSNQCENRAKKQLNVCSETPSETGAVWEVPIWCHVPGQLPSKCPTCSSSPQPLFTSSLRKEENELSNHKFHSPISDSGALQWGKNQCIDDLQTFHGERKAAAPRRGGEQSSQGEGHGLSLTAGWWHTHRLSSHVQPFISILQAIFGKQRNRGKKQEPQERQRCEARRLTGRGRWHLAAFQPSSTSTPKSTALPTHTPTGSDLVHHTIPSHPIHLLQSRKENLASPRHKQKTSSSQVL